MGSYQDIRRRWLASLRRSGADFVYLLASSSIFPVPPTSLDSPAAPGTAPASPDPATELTASELRAWQQLVREFSAKPTRDTRRGPRSR
jgi:hypothetical protein